MKEVVYPVDEQTEITFDKIPRKGFVVIASEYGRAAICRIYHLREIPISFDLHLYVVNNTKNTTLIPCDSNEQRMMDIVQYMGARRETVLFFEEEKELLSWLKGSRFV